MNSEQTVYSRDSNSVTRLRHERSISIYSVNVCGLKSKLFNPDFLETVSSYDILCFTETKTDKADIPLIEIPGFVCFPKNRTDLSIRKSGGVAIYVKQELASFVQVINSPCPYILWISCNGQMLNLPDNLLIGTVYIPPENSRYSSADLFQQIQQDVLTLSCNYRYISIIGDFNSRTASLPDYIDIPDDGTNHDLFANDVQLLDYFNIPKVRKSLDVHRNNYGSKLLDLCKHTNLFVANGRIGSDKSVGNFTCKNVSVIDYCIGNVNFLSLMSDFHVLPFSVLFSDVHSALTIQLKGNGNNCTNENSST